MESAQCNISQFQYTDLSQYVLQYLWYGFLSLSGQRDLKTFYIDSLTYLFQPFHTYIKLRLWPEKVAECVLFLVIKKRCEVEST